MILVTRPNDLKLHKLTICLALWHVVGNQKPLKGPSELMLYNNFCQGLHADPLSKTNYRPVSVLPVFSKIFEKVFETQLSDFFDKTQRLFFIFILSIIFFNFIRCYMLEFKIFLHIHMIFNFHNTRVNSGVIENYVNDH
jgi:hypothetical protein